MQGRGRILLDGIECPGAYIEDDTITFPEPLPPGRHCVEYVNGSLGATFHIEILSPPDTSAALAGSICEQCLDAPAVALMSAERSEDMGVCAACLENGGS